MISLGTKSRRKLIENTKNYALVSAKGYMEYDLFFYKHDVRIVHLLENFFPKVLSKIIYKYTYDIFLVQGISLGDIVQFRIPQFKFTMTIKHIMYGTMPVHLSTFRYNLFHMQFFALSTLDEFIKKYYAKTYFSHYYTNDSHNHLPKLSHAKELKYCAVIMKIIFPVLYTTMIHNYKEKLTND